MPNHRNHAALQQKLTDLEQASLAELRDLWLRYFKSPAPVHYQRHFLIRRIGYHLQAMAEGGLSKSARGRLKRLAADPTIMSPAHYTVTPGTRIVKDWNGKRLIVIVEGKQDFVFEGKRYKSLSAIARELVGSPQSGPLFFGLRQRKQATS